VATGLDLGKVDFVREMTAAVTTGLTDARLSLGRTDRDIAALAALGQRIRRDGDGPNLFAERLDSQLTAKATEQQSARRRVLLLETAVVELGNYRSEVELVAAISR
jgi:hypothetical protein